MKKSLIRNLVKRSHRKVLQYINTIQQTVDEESYKSRSRKNLLGKSLPFGQLIQRGLALSGFDKSYKRVFRFGEGLSSRIEGFSLH